ncbi:MAG: DHH family phosphoesterase [Cellulosilyticaceae bacterium]
MFSLTELLDYNYIVIQCHNNPDADTVASGFALYTYLKSHDCHVRLVYGGPFEITKPNLKLLIEELAIPIEYVKELDLPDALVTVDCQYNAGNAQYFEAPRIYMLDHHFIPSTTAFWGDIRSSLGSCSTLIWDLLKATDFNFDVHQDVATALYYGLLMDTNFLSEVRHPLDRDMNDSLQIKSNKSTIRRLRFSNLSLNDLETAGIALIRSSINTEDKFAVFKAKPCDPNILGIISDMAIQVDDIWACIVYFETDTGIKFSVRSCSKEIKANELALYVTDGIGSGGGHIDKAGGYISTAALNNALDTGTTETYFHNKTNEYFNSFDIIYAKDYIIDVSDMPVYKKNRLIVGYVPTTEIFTEGTSIQIRTLEGDLDVISSPDTYILVGIEGETQPIERQKFERSYCPIDAPFDISFSYIPTVKNDLTHEPFQISEYMSPCLATGSVCIHAKPLTKNVKVFTSWDENQYLTGVVGDYLAVRQDDYHDIYVIRKQIFHKTYTLKEE